MEDRCTEESSDADGASGSSVYNLHSEDSRNSTDSYLLHNDDPMDGISYDGWDSDVYCNTSDNDVKEEFRSIQAREPSIEVIEDTSENVEIIEETLEENNNDPNNNMDSIEMNGPIEMPASPPLDASSSGSTGRRGETPADAFVVRASSPKPGCSKDSLPVLPYEPVDEEAILEKTRHILSLVAKIHRDSIFDALCKNDRVPISELKLWDLLPENERQGYPDIIFCERKEPRVPSDIEMQQQRQWMATPSEKSSKRAPADDICTVQSKRSSSDPDLSNLAPRAPMMQLPAKPMIHRGAIPKVRGAPLPNDVVPHRVPLSSFATCQGVKTLAQKYSDRGFFGASSANQAPLDGANKAPPHQAITTTVNSTKITVKAPVLKYPVAKPVSSKPHVVNAAIQKTAAAQPVSSRPNPYAAKPAAAKSNPVAAKPVSARAGAAVLNTPNPASARVIPVAAKPVFSRAGAAVLETPNPALARAIPVAAKPVSSRAGAAVLDTPNPASVRAIPVAANPVSSRSAFDITTIPSLARAVPAAGKPVSSKPNPAAAHHGLPRPDVAVATAATSNTFDVEMQTVIAASLKLNCAAAKPVSLAATVPTIQQRREEKERQPPAPSQNPKRVVCMDMFYRLRNIFPNVDPEYVKKLCPPEWGPGDRDAQLAPLVEHLLERGDTLPQAPIKPAMELAEPDMSYSNADEIYETLLGIFPDADPHFLRDFAVTNVGKGEAVKNFVHTKLERRDYPTREQYMARLKITEQQRQYTTGFDVKQFLSIIPDPAKHFMDSKRKCTHQTVAFEFLKSHFNKIRVNTISKIYRTCGYNLSLTAESLDRLDADLKSRRGVCEMPTEDILLLQEIAFVKHKGTINSYISNTKRREEEEFKTLKALNQLFECQCCYDSECLPSKCSLCDNGHIFCNSCVVTGTSSRMGEDQTRIYCFINCGSEFSLSVLQQVLAPTTFSILLRKRQAAEVMEAGLEGLVSCPFCHFASIPPEDDKIFKCLNPECTKESCRLCKELSHVPLKCNEVMKADNARRFIEEKMTEALARKCYKCQRAFFKEEGCNKITCPCGAQMCYLCDEPIKDYQHFRGQGSDNKKLCPLYSDTIRLDAQAVRRVAEQAQQQVLKNNPNIKIDTTNLLPDIPRPRVGPHEHVLNADELPRRAQRVLDLPPL